MIIVSDAKGRTDGTGYALIQKIKTDIPMLLIARVDDYQFNEEILQLIGKPYILFDYVEMGWQWDRKESHIFGLNTDKFEDIFAGAEWKRLDNFIKTNPPKLFFVRELLKKYIAWDILPIEYPNWQPSIPIQTREEFNSRPINVMYFWGRSHEKRLQLQGDIWINAMKKGATVCDNIFYFNDFMHHERNNPNKWVALHIPHYGRTDISHLLAINGMSKLSVCLYGAGTKCFRTTGESPCNSVMIMQENDIAFSYQWVHGVNCLKFPTDEPDIEVINQALQRDDLYDIYVRGVETAEKYRVDNYINSYILPIINNP